MNDRHLSSEEVSQWIIGERTPGSESHARQCAACRAEIESLQNAFRLFRESGRRWSRQMDSAVVHSPAPAGALRAWAAPLAACVFMAAVLLLRPTPKTPAGRPIEQPFLEFPYVAPLAPYERTAVMRLNVPVSALIAAGFEVHVPDVGASLQADVVFGQDGRAHAIRLVSEVLPNSERRVNP